MGRTGVREESERAGFLSPRKAVTRSKDIICESNWKLRQATGNIRCLLENQVLMIANAHGVPGALGNRDELHTNFNPREWSNRRKTNS